MTNLPAGLPLNLLVHGAIGGSVSGFSWDQANYPDLNPPESVLCSWFSWQMYLYHSDGVVPAWHPVYCGVTIPDYSGDIDLARAAAVSVGLSGQAETATETAADVCNAIRAHVGSPWDQP